MAGPMHQFEIAKLKPLELAGYDVSFTNSSLWMAIAIGVIGVFMFVGTARPQLVPGRWQAAVEYVYDFVRNMLDENVGPEGRRYAPLIFRSEEHTSELQSLMRNSYAVFCLKKKKRQE